MTSCSCRTLLGLFTSLLLLLGLPALGQKGEGTQVTKKPNQTPEASPAEPSGLTLFRHSDTARYLILGQSNIIFQAHAPFHSPYAGPNSMLSRGEYKTSLVGTLFLGFQLNPRPRYSTDILFDEESAGGRGISEAVGIAGFTNLDVVRNPSLGSIPYTARVQLHQVIGFTDALVPSPRTAFSLSTQLPARRLELHLGRMGLPDFLDLNSVGSDSHLQFLNWTVDNNGAWDYAADTRGYTYGVIAEYVDDPHGVTARAALALMPTVANGIDLQWNLGQASGQNYELELRQPGRLVPALAPFFVRRPATLRLLAFSNRANMGNYRAQNQAAVQAGVTPVITAHSLARSVKYGFGLNLEQAVTPNLRAFARFGWNEGQHESFAYTEVDQTLQAGLDLSAKAFAGPFRRPADKLGLAFVSNAIKRDHQAYLALGGRGFLLGDSRLHYAREDILEAYYNLHVRKGIYYALDAQYIARPGYNQDRGPILVESLRMHVDF